MYCLGGSTRECKIKQELLQRLDQIFALHKFTAKILNTLGCNLSKALELVLIVRQLYVIESVALFFQELLGENEKVKDWFAYIL